MTDPVDGRADPVAVDGATDPTDGRGSAGLADRVRSAEGRPLEDRAVAFAAIHDELRTRLEGGEDGTGNARA